MGRIDVLYLSPTGKYFVKRACLGDKTYGMSVNYASDSKWGLSIAHIARDIEKGVSGVPDPQPVTDLLQAIDLVNPFREYYRPHDITGDGRRETFCNWFVADVLNQLHISLPRYGAEAGHYPRPHPNTEPRSRPSRRARRS